MLSYRKIGGMRFLRIGRLQISFCVVRKAPEHELIREEERLIRRAKRVHQNRAARWAYQMGFPSGWDL